VKLRVEGMVNDSLGWCSNLQVGPCGLWTIFFVKKCERATRTRALGSVFDSILCLL
jgi:hypothetical protein